ncbi:hypothetical protein JCM17844_28600 [Iodidimonas gelatinilytica]|uniref:Uncharacterized protein n=1 Tax=Iodidimonas gelatinilytica TaxID=1236966 RepID=A0A5A7MV74_9PROT|nr:hypothetical protein [Iodidimonas gelatinilytica]GEQ99223.1 hypothetical protein JCM17844_28600 [Iodidimonas gelatinilytica]
MDTSKLPHPLRAWKFLRRNPNYQAEWRSRSSKIRRASDEYDFPIHRQTRQDLRAAQWGLLAYEDPNAGAGHAAPFWAIGPMLDAEISEDDGVPLLPALCQSGARVSGLRLQGGGLVLTVTKDGTAMQLRFPNDRLPGSSFGVVLRIPLGLRLPVLLSCTHDLWTVLAGEQFKKVEAAVRGTWANCFSLLTA